MKKLLALLLAAFVAAPAPFALAAADSLKVAPSFYGANPTYDANGVLTAATWQAGFTQWAMVDAKKLSAQTNVNWDGMREDFVVVVDGNKLTPKQVSQAVGLIAAYVLANPQPPASP